MKKLSILSVLTLFLLAVFSSTVYAKDLEKAKYRTFKQGKIEVQTNLPEDINPIVSGQIIDKHNNKTDAPGKVKHTLIKTRNEDGKIAYDIKTEVYIQAIYGPYPDDGSDYDPYSHMYQRQTMDWTYYKNTETFERFYKISKTTCWWERSRTNLIVDPGSVGIKIDVMGRDMTGLPVGPDGVIKNGLTPTWQSSNLRTNDIVVYGKSSWPYAYPQGTGMFGQCDANINDAYGYVATLTTQITL